MRTVKDCLMVAWMLLLALCVAGGVGAQMTATAQRVTNIADVAAFYAANPQAPPINSGRTLAAMEGKTGQGLTVFYSKQWATNADGTLAMVSATNGPVGVVRVSDGAYLGTIAQTRTNPVTNGLQPRWVRDGGPADEIIWVGHDQTQIVRQRWNDHTTQRVICVAPKAGDTQLKFISDGGEGDISDNGRYRAIKLSTGYSNGYFQNVECGVVDLIEGRLLPGRVAGNPNGLDVTPDGRWMAMLNHSGTPESMPNKFYLIEELAQGVVRPVPVDSHAKLNPDINQPWQSIGHSGWARTVDGKLVLVYQDNRDDWFKYFDPETGTSTRIAYYTSIFPWGSGQHIGRGGPAGYALLSTYLTAEPLIGWLELATGKVHKVADTRTKRDGYWTEAFAAVSTDLQWIYWGCNDDGADNLEVWRVASAIERLPGGGGAEPGGSVVPEPTPTPEPTPMPTPQPTPVPTPTPPVVGEVITLPDGVPARPEQWFVSAYYQWGVLSGEKIFGPYDQAGAEGKADGLSSRYRRKALVRVPGEFD